MLDIFLIGPTYSYNLREDDLSVVDIALHRSAAVIVGVVWAAVLSRFWWPAQARRELSIGLGELSAWWSFSLCDVDRIMQVLPEYRLALYASSGFILICS